VSHFGGQVLSESQTSGVNTDLDQEQVHTGNEITKSLVVDNTLGDHIANSAGNWFLVVELQVTREKSDHSVGHRAELGVRLLIGQDKVFNFGQCKFSTCVIVSIKRLHIRLLANVPDTQQTRSGSNFVSESRTNLGGSEGQFAGVVLQQALEVDEHTLSGLRAEETAKIELIRLIKVEQKTKVGDVPRQFTSGTNLSREHQIEGKGVTDGVTSVGRLNLVSFNHGTQIHSVESVDGDAFSLQLFFIGGLNVLLF
jgi:hypothetical protein